MFYRLLVTNFRRRGHFARLPKLNESLLLLIVGNSGRYQRSQIATLAPKDRASRKARSAARTSVVTQAFRRAKERNQLRGIVQPKRAPLESSQLRLSELIEHHDLVTRLSPRSYRSASSGSRSEAPISDTLFYRLQSLVFARLHPPLSPCLPRKSNPGAINLSERNHR